MSIPNNPQGPVDLQSLLGRTIAEAAGKQLLNGLLGGGARRGIEAGMEMAKDIKLGDIISTVEKVFEDVNASRPAPSSVPSETLKEEVHIPFMKAESTPAAPTAPAEPVIRLVPNTVITGHDPIPSTTEKESPKPKPMDDGAPANESIDALYELATSHLTPAQHAELVTCVMNLVRHASPEGFTGEHVGWLSRLYGNKTI